MNRTLSASRSVPPDDPNRYVPHAGRPVRCKARHLAASMRIQPHRHPWAQVAFSATGVIRMDAGSATYIVPPSRMVWIPPDVEHRVTVVEDAEIRTLYLHQPSGHAGPAGLLGADSYEGHEAHEAHEAHQRLPESANADPADPAPVGTGPVNRWQRCQVLEVSPLLRELINHLPVERGQAPSTPRERHLCALVCDELLSAKPLPLGVDLPQDKRLRALCEAVLDDPARWQTLQEWAKASGASPRTAARLFRAELKTTFVQWRQQVLLARALTLAAARMPMTQIAAELGYASPSAFSAMVRRSVGQPPSRFFSHEVGHGVVHKALRLSR